MLIYLIFSCPCWWAGKRNEEVIRMEGVIRRIIEELRLVNLFFHIYVGG